MAQNIELIRNIGIIAHIDAGKTTTTERILFYTGTTHRMGNVDEGTTVTDFDPEEAERGITIYSAAISCRWGDKTVNLIDTPGHVDFTAEVERSLRVLDGGIVVFSAVEGVEAQSETVWRQANRYRVPRICFINKMDRIGADFERTFHEIENRLHARPVALQLPIGAGSPPDPKAFRGIIDLIERKALYFDSESNGAKIEVAEIPNEFQAQAEAWRRKLLDAVSDLDDEALTIYIESGDIPPEEIHRVLRLGTLHNQIQPTFCGSALDYIGVQPVLDGVSRYLPSPLDVPAIEGRHPKKETPERRKPSDDDPFCGLVFKIQADPHADLYFVRVYSGVLKTRSRPLNPRTGKKEMVNQLWRIHAEAREKVEEDSAHAGDIIGVIGPKDTVTGDTLCEANHPILLETISFPETVISMAVEPDTSADRKKLEDVLRLLSRQDPTFRAQVSEETGQTIISGMGELHLEIIRGRMLRDFNLNVRVHKPRVSYRETVKRAVEVEGTFQRQAQGVSQYAGVKLRVEPFEGEVPVTIESKVKPGTLPEELREGLLQAVSDRVRGSGVVGYPLMKVKITVADVDYREGETTDLALQAAAAQGVDKAMNEAGVVLLEPIMKLEVVTPDEFLGNIQADLNARRAMIVNTERRGGDLIAIEAEAPLSQMFGYSTQVRSLSQGRASYSMEPLKYQPAPPEVLEAMMA